MVIKALSKDLAGTVSFVDYRTISHHLTAKLTSKPKFPQSYVKGTCVRGEDILFLVESQL